MRQNISIPLPDSVIILVSGVATSLRAGRSHNKGWTSSLREGFSLGPRVQRGSRSHSIAYPVDIGGIFLRREEGEACS